MNNSIEQKNLQPLDPELHKAYHTQELLARVRKAQMAPLTLQLTYFTARTSLLIFHHTRMSLNDSASCFTNFILSHSIKVPKKMPAAMYSSTRVCSQKVCRAITKSQVL